MSNTNLQTDKLEESFELPAKYQGKTAAEIAKMHMDAEAEKSRLGNEVGSLRQIADRFLGLEQERTRTARQERKPVTTDDILTNPDETLEKAIEEHPVVQSLTERLERAQLSMAQVQFEKAHPDFQQDLSDPDFVEWVKKSKIRTALAVNANEGNYEAADSLWSLWDERKSELKETKAEKAAARAKAEKLGALEGGGTSGLETDRIYSRVELMTLHQKALSGDPEAKAKWNDPSYQAERAKAYKEGRVR